MLGGGRNAQLQVEACGRMSGSGEDAFLDKGIENEKIGKWLRIRWWVSGLRGYNDKVVGRWKWREHELLRF